MGLLDDNELRQSQLFADPLGSAGNWMKQNLLSPFDAALAQAGFQPSYTPPAGASASDIFHAVANPNAVLNSPAAQAGLGFMPLSIGNMNAQGLRDLQTRIISGIEGMSGEAKYDALRQIAARLREIEGQASTAVSDFVTPGLQNARDIMQRVDALRLNPMRFKKDQR